jgi:hypothetical protein
LVTNERASQLNASAEKIWKLFSTEDGQRTAAKGFVAAIAFEGIGVGLTRKMRTEGHLGEGYVEERCEHFNDEEMEIAYRITDTGGLVPFADYLGRAKVIRAGPEACILILKSTFIPVDMSEADALELSRQNFELLYNNIQAAIDAGEAR